MVLTQYSSVPGSEKLRPGEEFWQIAGQTTCVPISIADPPAPKKSFEQMMADYLADAKAKSRQKKKRKRSGQYANSDPQIKFLRERISRLTYGTKVPDKGVFPELTIEKFIVRYSERRYGDSLKNDQFYDHFAGRATHYFWCHHTASSAEVLVNIDID